jgi:ABC-type multidrug transport system fused ATPase/permease subunit
MTEPLNIRIRNAHIAGLAHAYSQTARMMFMGLVFWTGSVMITKYDWPTKDVYLCINTLMHAAMGIGMSLSNAPSVERAKAAASNIFQIIDEKSTLDVRDGRKAPIQHVEAGGIVFKDVDFKYPARKHQRVLNKFNMEIKPTQKIALVGASGCGKSTITNLLLRFYNLDAGTIEIDGHDISEYNVENLRRGIGYVMQEPILFNQNIKDNILFGQPDASDKDIRKVCELANALSFIESDIEDKDKLKYIEYVEEQLS